MCFSILKCTSIAAAVTRRAIEVCRQRLRDGPVASVLVGTMRTAMYCTVPDCTGVMLRPLSVTPVHAPRIDPRQQQLVNQRAHRQRTLAAASDVDSPEEVQSVSDGPDRQKMKQRIRSKVNAWRRPRTSNSSPISVSFATDAQRAAALVLSDLSDTKPTRIVARSPEDIAKAISIIHIVSNGLARAEESLKLAADIRRDMHQQMEQQVLDHKVPPKSQVLVFQPQQVFGVMVNPPDLPEGAQLLYTYPLPADDPVYQQAVQAYEDAKAISSADEPWRLNISPKGSAFNAGRDLAGVIQAHGWAELNCIGGPVAVANGIQAITYARREVRESKVTSGAEPVRDVAVVYQGFLKQHSQQRPEQANDLDQIAQPELEPPWLRKLLDDQQQERVVKGDGTYKKFVTQQQYASTEGTVRQFDRINTFLVLGCAPNKPKQLVKLPA